MAVWAVRMPWERYQAERLFHHEALDLPDAVARADGRSDTARAAGWLGSAEPTAAPGSAEPSSGDATLVMVDDPPRVVALGRLRVVPGVERNPDDPQSDGGGALVVEYTRRLFDDPVPAEGTRLAGPLTAVDEATYRRVVERLGPPPVDRRWLVSVDMPVEAPSPAEAARLFWSYVADLGPRELPAFVSPAGDESAMTAYVGGEPANQDPEED